MNLETGRNEARNYVLRDIVSTVKDELRTTLGCCMTLTQPISHTVFEHKNGMYELLRETCTHTECM